MIPSQKTILITCGLAILLAAIPLHQIGVFEIWPEICLGLRKLVMRLEENRGKDKRTVLSTSYRGCTL